MNIPLVDLKAQYAHIKPDIDAAIQRVLDNTSFILGSEVAGFEADFAKYVGAAGAVGVTSGTAALLLALLAYDVGPGDEVIVPANTFFATAEAVSVTGATPVFVDADPQSYLMDVAAAAAAITSKTKVLLPVHLFGQPADMEALMELARRHGLKLIEDAAQAHGSQYQGQPCGSIGDLACFSFYPGKNLGAYGDGGMVTGNDEAALEIIRILRDHGSSKKYVHDRVGWGYRLDALQAAILAVKLPHLESWTEARRHWAARYDELLAGTDLILPTRMPDRRHVFHLYVVRTPRRDDVLAKLHAAGIGAGIHYPLPLNQQPAYREQNPDLKMPVSETLAREILSLPLYPDLTEEKVAYVAATLKQINAG